MARDGKLEHLAQVRLFESLNRKELAEVGKAADLVTAPAGSEIVVQDTIGHEFYLIVSGKAAVRRNRRRIATLGPGDYFGELALLAHGPRTATVSADEDMELLVIGQRQFRAVLDAVPAMTYKLLATMAERLRIADTRDTSA
jgi:CRP/FNR family transcriptional regulator, cyclic AMP receptor protein